MSLKQSNSCIELDWLKRRINKRSGENMQKEFGFYQTKNGHVQLIGISGLNIKITEDEQTNLMSKLTKYNEVFDVLSNVNMQWQDIHDLNLKINSVLANYDEFDNEQNYVLNFESELAKNIGQYCLRFFELVEFNERSAKKFGMESKFKKVKSDLYDNDPDYAIAYVTGLFAKHRSKMIPIESSFNKDGNNYYISVKQVRSQMNSSKSREKILSLRDKVSCIEILDHVEMILNSQMSALALMLFNNLSLNYFFELERKFLNPFGLPIYLNISPEKTKKKGQYTIAIKAPYDYHSFSQKATNSFILINELGLANINIKIKRLRKPIPVYIYKSSQPSFSTKLSLTQVKLILKNQSFQD
jgi:hypothetical protein